MDGHLSRSVNLETRVHLLYQPDDSDVLHDRRIDTPIYRLAEKCDRVFKLGRFYQSVECQVDPRAPGMRKATRDFYFIQC